MRGLVDVKLDEKSLLYEAVAAKLVQLIECGTYQPGTRIPSVRVASRQMRVSINTVMAAYAQLENGGFIEARPQSGYFVRSRMAEPVAPAVMPDDEPSATPVVFDKRVLAVRRNLARSVPVSLAGGAPNSALLPAEQLNRILAARLRRSPKEAVSYAAPHGLEALRAQIARRAPESGVALAPADIVITSGCMEAVALALQATCRPGDTVAVGSPVYYTFLNIIQWLGLKVLEIPSSPREGLNLDLLALALSSQPVRACLVLPNFNNPLGGVMPDEKKRALVELLARHDLPLIEDDVYGDLGFAPLRPYSCKAFDKKGLVLSCSSFSKTLAPGYRIGWIAPGRYLAAVQNLKSLFSGAAASPSQLAIAEFLSGGFYDRHLRRLRAVYQRQVSQMREAVGHCFPAGTRVTRPEGGYAVWVEMPEGVDAVKLHDRAIERGIAIAPGRLFSTQGLYRSSLRLNAALWSPRVEAAIKTLGKLASQI